MRTDLPTCDARDAAYTLEVTGLHSGMITAVFTHLYLVPNLRMNGACLHSFFMPPRPV